MKYRSIAVLGLAGMLMTSACSSTDEKAQTKVNATTNSNSNTVAVNSGTAVSGPQPADANAAPAASSDELGAPSDRLDRVNAMRKAGEAGPPVDPRALALKNARPAPDNSTFASYLTDAGYEIRTFKNHPQLLRVEKTIASNGSQSIKIFLKNGNVVELPGQRITTLATAPADFILNEAGLKPPPAQQAPGAGSATTKKPGN